MAKLSEMQAEIRAAAAAAAEEFISMAAEVEGREFNPVFFSKVSITFQSSGGTDKGGSPISGTLSIRKSTP